MSQVQMNQLLVVVVLPIAATVLPVMFAARLVGAARTGFWASLFAVFLESVLAGLARAFIPSPTGVFVASVIGGALIFARTLGTTFLRGLAIGFLAVLIAVLVVYFAFLWLVATVYAPQG